MDRHKYDAKKSLKIWDVYERLYNLAKDEDERRSILKEYREHLAELAEENPNK